MSRYKEILVALTENASHVNKGDLLMEVRSGLTFPVSSKEELSFSTDQKPLMQLVQQAKNEEKESGIFPLCFAEYLFKWNFRQEELQSPILLYPCSHKLNKVHAKISIELLEEQRFINPLLHRMLKNEFDLSLSDDPDLFFLGLENAGFGRIEKCLLLGNFHHHRFDILRDLEAIQQQDPHPSIQELFGEAENEAAKVIIDLSDAQIEPCDPDQLKALRSSTDQNTVVQGPPGTGKSQVLTNLLAKILLSGEQALVVSEKRVALEVLVKKLRIHGLDRYVFTSTDSKQSREFLSELKESWLELESQTPFPFVKHDPSAGLMGSLQLLLDTLNSPEACGGLSYSEFLSVAQGRDLSKGTFDSSLPSVKDWLIQAQLIEKLYAEKLQNTVANFQIGMLRREQLQTLDTTLYNLLTEFERLSGIIAMNTWGDLLKAMKCAAMAHYFSTDLYRRYANLLKKGSSPQKKFLVLRKRYLKLIAELKALEPTISDWKKIPSEQELTMLLTGEQETRFFARHRFRRLWRSFSSMPVEQAPSMLQTRKEQLLQQRALSRCTQDFLDMNIDQPEIYVELIYRQISEHPFESEALMENWSPEKLQQLAESNKALLDLHTQLKLVFQFREEHVLKELATRSIRDFPKIREHFLCASEYSAQIHRALALYATFQVLDAAVFHTNYEQFLLRFPFVRNVQASTLLQKCEKIFGAQSLEAKVLANQIHESRKHIFDSHQQLLRTPSAKLSVEKKAFRERLKRGKSILVKAFAKKRNLPSLRHLYESEASEWIRILKPICLCNPSQAARIFPLEKDLFTFGIFDEASQISLENALGSIYRSKRILVAGDSQQMSPATFFKAGSKERLDLLHQSSFYWKSVTLKHHYRSEHPGLIQFSNRYFYQSELKAFPSAYAEEHPVQLHLVEGVYQGGVNLKEAQEVAEELERHLSSTLSIGVVAFSKNQLETIRSFLSPRAIAKMNERMEVDTLFFNSLENVQGDECDILLISLGYGLDSDGKFHMRFGPLNQSGGDKRLNVLFSRARKKIHLYTSVRSSDFKLSPNEGVELLRRYLQDAENELYSSVTDAFLNTYRMARTGHELILKSPQQTFPNALDMVTFVRVLRQREWKLTMEF